MWAGCSWDVVGQSSGGIPVPHSGAARLVAHAGSLGRTIATMDTTAPLRHAPIALLPHLPQPCPPCHAYSQDIVQLEIPVGCPLVYELDEHLTPLRHYYLGHELLASPALDVMALPDGLGVLDGLGAVAVMKVETRKDASLQCLLRVSLAAVAVRLQSPGMVI